MTFSVLIDVIGTRLTVRQLAKLLLIKRTEIIRNSEVINEALNNNRLTTANVIQYINGDLTPQSEEQKTVLEQLIREVVMVDNNAFFPLGIYCFTHDVNVISIDHNQNYTEESVQIANNKEMVLGIECNSYDLSHNSKPTDIIESPVSHYIATIVDLATESSKRLYDLGLLESEPINIYRVQNDCRCCSS